MAASTPRARTGWSVTSTASSGVRQRVQEAVLRAQGAVLRHVAARLPHEPHGRAVHLLEAAGAEEAVVHLGIIASTAHAARSARMPCFSGPHAMSLAVAKPPEAPPDARRTAERATFVLLAVIGSAVAWTAATHLALVHCRPFLAFCQRANGASAQHLVHRSHPARAAAG